MTRRFLLSSLCFVCAALVPVGCQPADEIRSYTVSKEAIDFGAGGEKQRMLAVMVPREKDVWFFKLMGPEKAVGEQAETFDRFVSSVRFGAAEGGDAGIRWTAPEGWKEERGAQLGAVYARLRRQGDGPTLDITVTRLPAGEKSKDPRSNIDRWRGQLGLGTIGAVELNRLVGNVKVDGLEGTRVDFVGSARKPGGAPMAVRRPFRFSKPDGWEEMPPDTRKGVYRPAVFRVRQGEHVAEVSVVPLAGQGGGARANVNRWRMQLGLQPVGDDELQKELRQIDRDGGAAPYVDLLGEGTAGPQRILGAWIAQGGRTWFITMKGSPELVGKQRDAFEAFVKSIRFGDDGGAARE